MVPSSPGGSRQQRSKLKATRPAASQSWRLPALNCGPMIRLYTLATAELADSLTEARRGAFWRNSMSISRCRIIVLMCPTATSFFFGNDGYVRFLPHQAPEVIRFFAAPAGGALIHLMAAREVGG